MQASILGIILLLSWSIHGSELSSSLKGLKNTFSGSGGLLAGAEQSIGIVNGYPYSYRVFNNTPVNIGVASQRVTPIMGAKFNGEVKQSATVQPFTDTGTYFNDQDLYIDVWILHTNTTKDAYAAYGDNVIRSSAIKGAEYGSVIPGIGNLIGSAIGALVGSINVDKKLSSNKILHKKIALGKKNDTNVYYYNVYCYNNQLKAEYLGIATTSTDFNGVFHNSSQQQVALKFMKGSDNFQVTLEPQSFNLLNSSKQSSIRPIKGENRSFSFLYKQKVIANIPINEYGIATMVTDPKSSADNPTFIKGSPYTYTYEVHQDSTQDTPKISMQGLAIGNHTQAGTTANTIRDINPVECNFLLYSPAAYNQRLATKDTNALQNAYDPQGHYWYAYSTKDMTLYKELTADRVCSDRILRPQLSEANASLYVVWTASNDAQKITSFLQRLCNGTLHSKSSTNLIDDPLTGIQGMVLLEDTFNPVGLGNGPYYYTLYPPLLNVSALSDPLEPFIDVKKCNNSTSVSDYIQKNIMQWIMNNKLLTTNSLSSFITQHAYETVGQNKSMINKLSAIMYRTLTTSNLPYIYQAGSNNYVYEQSNYPSHWPVDNTDQHS